MSPGPNSALISRLAVSGSRRTAIGATFGLAFASTFYATLTMTGLALVLARVGWLATVIQVAGGCYLVFLGVKAWLTATPLESPEPSDSRSGKVLRGLRVGSIVNLANPKVITFFVSLYTVTVPAKAAPWVKLTILAGGFLVELVWYGAVILLLSTLPARAAYARFGVWIERAIDAALAAFGFRLISEKL